MTSFIIGASGVIGSALRRNLASRGESVVGTCTGRQATAGLVAFDLRGDAHREFAAGVAADDVVYLLAAYSNPSWIHDHREEATALNRDGTQRFIDALRPRMPRLVFMSSVEVFDGEKGGYAEGDKPNPLNYYGLLKLDIENYLRDRYPRATIVRTGWNVGQSTASRCVVRLTYETLLKPGARMATDNEFSIIDADDTAEGLRRVGAHEGIGEMHLAADTVIRRDRLADLVMRSSKNGAAMRYEPCQFADIAYSEPRGRLNDLRNEFSKSLLGMNYRDAEEVAQRKVELLDQGSDHVSTTGK